MVKPAADTVTLLRANWDKSIIRRPQIEKMTKKGQYQVANSNWVLVQELTWTPDNPHLTMTFQHSDWIVRIDIRTRSDEKLDLYKESVEKVMNEQNLDMPGYSYVIPQSGNELSNRQIPLFRYVYEYRLTKVGIKIK